MPLRLVSKAPAVVWEVGGNGVARHVGAARPVHGDAVTPVATAAAQEGGVGQPAAGRVQLDDEGVC